MIICADCQQVNLDSFACPDAQEYCLACCKCPEHLAEGWTAEDTNPFLVCVSCSAGIDEGNPFTRYCSDCEGKLNA